MKKTQMLMLAAIISCGTLIGCNGQADKATQAPQETEQVAKAEGALPAYSFPEANSYTSAICSYLTDSIGKGYSQGDVCIPSISIVKADETNPDDIKVWGDYWVFNYKQAGDTLKCVSGGSHAGLMHIKKTSDNYAVISFDQVADGSDNLPSAKKIFGENYEVFHAINSNQEAREKVRHDIIADYIKANKLPFTCYQDYGWDPVKITE